MQIVKLAVLIILLTLTVSSFGGEAYLLEPSFDGPFLITSALSVYMAYQIESYITPPILNTLSKDDINRLDRFAAGLYSESLENTGNYLLALTAFPVILGMYGESRGYEYTDALTDGMMYLESCLLTYSMCIYINGFELRPRPVAYNSDLTDQIRRDRKNSGGFYSLNTALVANAVSFTSTVFSRRFPDSRLLPFLKIGGASAVCIMGYTQIASGQNFPTDVIFGAFIGGATGYMIPAMHELSANIDVDVLLSGLQLTYHF